MALGTTPARDAHWADARAPRLSLGRVDALRRSLYVRMRDGTPIAVDVYVPRGGRVATIVRQTRYGRSLLPRRPFAPLVMGVLDHYQALRRAFLRAGFAWVDVDVRGSGASGGTQCYPWNPDEVRDGAEVVDWIVRQPWSSGRVGSLGISYDGTSAEMLLVNRHPAVRAVAPLFSLFDAYADVAFPGGVHLLWFTEQWGRFNAMLDRNAPHEAFALLTGQLATAHGGLASRVPPGLLLPGLAGLLGGVQQGIRPVDERELPAALAAHAANYLVHESALAITHRDDRDIVATHPDATIDAFSPHAFVAETSASGAAVYSYSGWRDGGYMHAAIKRHRAIGGRGSRLTLGPWIHSGRSCVTPFAETRASGFDHGAELVDFFVEHLHEREPRAADRKAVHYFTMGEGWKSADVWPPREAVSRVLHLGASRRLTEAPPSSAERDHHRIDPSAGTGPRSRWRTLIAPVPADYPDRARRDETLLCYDSPRLARAMQVTGHPIVVLHVAWLDATDGRIFAYLEDLAPDGQVSHVTEGMLRALHRRRAPGDAITPVPHRTFRRADAVPLALGEPVELAFDLLPVSYRFAAGHRLRLALAGADVDSFGESPAATIEVHRALDRPSRLELPVIGRAIWQPAHT